MQDLLLILVLPRFIAYSSSTKICDKHNDLNFEIVNFPFLDGDALRSTSYGVYISQLILFARASSYITDFNTCSKLFTQKLLKQGYLYHKLHKTFSKFYRRYYDLISKFQVGLKGDSNPNDEYVLSERAL